MMSYIVKKKYLFLNNAKYYTLIKTFTAMDRHPIQMSKDKLIKLRTERKLYVSNFIYSYLFLY